MDRNTASKLARQTLDKYGLNNWGVRLTTDINVPFLGRCMGNDKCIILNAHHIDIHPDEEIIDTILHETAHALTLGHGHDEVWQAKAKELGAIPTACSHLDLPPHVIDAIRSGATVEMTVEEEHYVVKTPKFKVTRLQDKCPECGKVAIEKFALDTIDRDGNQVKLITLACFHIIKKVIPRGTPFETMVSNGWKPEIAACKHDWPTKENKPEDWQINRCLKCGEFKLLPFQIDGAKFAESALSMQKGAGIFDDMGLGKTVQALAVLKYHKEYSPTLFIVKSGIKFQFFKEIIRWLGPDYLGQAISTSKDYVFPGLKTYIISFDLLRRFPREKLQKLGIKSVVIDECQQIKNPDSSRTKEVRMLVSNPEVKVIPLSGTPWKNRGAEFFPVLNMLDPIKFYSYQHFLDTWVDYYWQGDKRKMGGIKNPAKFREFTSSIMIRREFDEVMDERPDINRVKLNVQLDELQQSSYDESVGEFVKWYNQAVIDGTEDQLSGIELIGRMARMRHICGLAKIPATLGMAQEFIEDTDKKLVIFVHHKDVGELMLNALNNTSKESNPEWYELAETIKSEGIKLFKLTAEFSDTERFTIGEEFNKCPRAIMIASTLASGEGINLQTCADAIMHERQWNPQNEEQAAPGRFRRIGQRSKVINITFVEGEGTIDADLDEIVERKRLSFHSVMNKGEAPKWNESDIIRELAATIVRKHQAKFKANTNTNVTMMAGRR